MSKLFQTRIEKIDETIKEKLQTLKIDVSLQHNIDDQATLDIIELLVDKLNEIPDWVWGYKCCPPGQECCNCS